MENIEKRSGCPLSCSLELIGDKWSLLILRDMIFFGKNTYNELLGSAEKISTNILNNRLIKLTEDGLITYSGTAKRKKYTVTEMGFDLKPVIEAIGIFGMKHFSGSKEYLEEQFKQLKPK